MTSFTLITALLLYSQNSPSTPRHHNPQEMVTFQTKTNQVSSENPYFSPTSTVAINMPPSNPEQLFLRQEIREKTIQTCISGLLTTTVAGLTLYYAATTDKENWLSGTMGSYCTNTVLTFAATIFLYRDRRYLLKKKEDL